MEKDIVYLPPFSLPPARARPHALHAPTPRFVYYMSSRRTTCLLCPSFSLSVVKVEKSWLILDNFPIRCDEHTTILVFSRWVGWGVGGGE